MISFIELHDILHFMGESVSIITNTIVLYFVINDKSKTLQEYRIILFINCFVDYICTFAQTINKPRVEIVQGIYVHFIPDFLSTSNHFIQCFVAGLYAGSLGIGMTTLSIQFYCRYKIVNNCQLKRSLLFKLLGLCILLSLFYLVNYGMSFYVHTQLVDSRILEKNPYINSNSTFIITKTSSSYLRVMVVGAVMCINFEMIVIIILSYLTSAKLRETKNMSLQTARLHRQMNILMISQVILVFFNHIFPHAMYVVFVTANIELYGAGTAISSFLAFANCINPIATLAFVGRFRQQFLHLISCHSKENIVRPDRVVHYIPSIA